MFESSRCVSFLLLAPVSLVFQFVAKSVSPLNPIPRSFLAISLADYAAGLSVASSFCPVRSLFPLLSLRGTSVVEVFLSVPVALGSLYLYGLSQELVSL